MSGQFNGAVTATGASLITEAIANNTKMSFLKIIGSTTSYTDAQLPTLTDEVLTSASRNQTGHISNVTIKDETTIQTELTLDGSSVGADYQLNTVLILASVSGKDRLFAVLKANHPQYMTAYDGKSSTNLQINCSFKVANTDAVDITVDTAGTLTVDDYNRLHAYTDKQASSATVAANKHTDDSVTQAKSAATSQVAVESSTRSSAVAAETTARTKADSAESAARSTADVNLQKSAAANSSAIGVLRTSAAGYTDDKVTSAATVTSNSISDEAKARSTADSNEAATRSSAIVAETKARSAGDSSEANARSAADKTLTDSITKVSDKLDNTKISGTNLFIQNTSVPGYIDGNSGSVFGASATQKEIASDYIAVVPGETYMFQLWGITPATRFYWWGIGEYRNDKSYETRLYGSGATQTVDTEEHITKAIVIPANVCFVRVSYRTYDNYKVKFEKANIATDYSPAPEDKADDNAVVHQTGNEKISGNKTFNSPIIGALATRAATFKDFLVVAKSMYQYSGVWQIVGSAGVTNGPNGTVASNSLAVIQNAGWVDAGKITLFDVTNAKTYVGVVNGGVIKWGIMPDDNSVVHRTGNETVAGNKTFTGTNNFSEPIKARLAKIGDLTGDVTVNDKMTAGWYYLSGVNITDIGTNIYGFLFIYTLNGNVTDNSLVQELRVLSSHNEVYVREKGGANGGTWSNWGKIILDNQDHTITGKYQFTQAPQTTMPKDSSVHGVYQFDVGSGLKNALYAAVGNENGDAVGLGAGGLTIVGSGESVATYLTDNMKGTLPSSLTPMGNDNETTVIASDGYIYFVTNMQNNDGYAKEAHIDSSGNWVIPGTITASGGATFPGGVTVNNSDLAAVNAFQKLIKGDSVTDGGYVAVGNDGSDKGYVELGTTDDGDTAIFVRKRNASNRILTEAALLDRANNTSFPGTISSGGKIVATQAWVQGLNYATQSWVNGLKLASQDWTQKRYDVIDSRGTFRGNPGDFVTALSGQTSKSKRTLYDVGLSTTDKTSYGILYTDAMEATSGGVLQKFVYGTTGRPIIYYCTSTSSTTWSDWERVTTY